MRRKTIVKRLMLAAALILLAQITNKTLPKKGGENIYQYPYHVKYVIDGDTIVLSNNERVRYIGINSPEIHHPKKGYERLGNEAKEFNKKLLRDGRVRMEFDKEIRDKYGRLLAYVFSGDIFVNAEMVRKGFARAYPISPNIRYKGLFQDLENEAKRDRAGIWALTKKRNP